jgi:hypothetical protein
MGMQKLTSKSFNLDVSPLYLFSAKAEKRLVDQSLELPRRLLECNYHHLVNQYKENSQMNIDWHHEKAQDLDPLRREESQIQEEEPLNCKMHIVNHKSVRAASTIWKIQEDFLNTRHHKLIVRRPEWISQLVFHKLFMSESILVTAKKDKDHLKIGKDPQQDCKRILHLHQTQEEMNIQHTAAVQWGWAPVEEIQLK